VQDPFRKHRALEMFGNKKDEKSTKARPFRLLERYAKNAINFFCFQ